MEVIKDFIQDVVLSEIEANMLQKALDYSLMIMDIIKFVEVTNFDIDPFMIEKFWHSIKDDSPVYISREILIWMGYSGEFYTQRLSFKKLLKRKEINFREIYNTDPERNNFPSIEEDIKYLSNAVVAQSKWLIMNSDDFKDAILMLNTKNSSKIRKYYRTFEKLMKLNLLYTIKFRERANKMQITNLETMMEEMKLRSIKQEQLLLSIGYNLQELQEQKEEDNQKIENKILKQITN